MLKKFVLPVMISGVFDENLSTNVIAQLQWLEKMFGKNGVWSEELKRESLQPEIQFLINSPGGYVTDLFAIVDFMGTISIPYKTMCLGMAASCAAVLFSCAPKGSRMIGKNSTVLLHQVTAGAFGQLEDLKIAAKQAERMNEQIIKILSKNCNKTVDQVREDLDRDLYLNAEEAVAYGIADAILEPNDTEIKNFSVVKDFKGNQIFSTGETIEKKRAAADLEKKELKFEVKSQTEDEQFFYFEGYAASFGNVDDDGDIVCRGAFTRSLRETIMLDEPNERTVLWQHDVNQPIGKAVLCEDEIGLKFKAALPKSDTFVSGRVIPQIKNGSIRTMSFGYRVIDRYYKNDNRHITDAEIYEISPVTIPANKQSRIKSGDKNLSVKDLESITDASKFLKSKGFSKSETDDLIFALKKILKNSPACNEQEDDDACNELVGKILADANAISLKLK